MDDVSISLASEEDQEELVDFLAFNNGEQYRDLALKSVLISFSRDYARHIFIKAMVGDVIIGAAAFSEELFTVDTWGISWVSVHPDFRGEGIGMKLMKKCLLEIDSRTDRSVSVILGTYPDQTLLYDRLGFEKMGKDHEGGFYMIKHLMKP